MSKKSPFSIQDQHTSSETGRCPVSDEVESCLTSKQLKIYVTILSSSFLSEAMKDIYKETLEKVAEGAKFSVNFERRYLKLDGKYIIKDGVYEGNLGVPTTETQTALNEIVWLYLRYRNSIPSERSDAKRKTYFRALPEHELSNDDMLFGQRREDAQIALELYVLCTILNGSLNWEEFAGHKWFYKFPGVEGLIILKNWIITK